MKTILLLCILSFSFFVISCQKEHLVPDNELYFPKVRNIINNNCTNSCHSQSNTYYSGSSLVFETDEQITIYGGVIKAAVADPVSYGNQRMPLNGSLSEYDIDIIVKWYEKGGKTTD